MFFDVKLSFNFEVGIFQGNCNSSILKPVCKDISSTCQGIESSLQFQLRPREIFAIRARKRLIWEGLKILFLTNPLAPKIPKQFVFTKFVSFEILKLIDYPKLVFMFSPGLLIVGLLT